MKRILSIVMALVMVLVFSGCEKGNKPEALSNDIEVLINDIEDKSQVVSDSRYVMNNCDEALAPYILLEGKPNEGKFTFVYSVASSYVAFGKYHISNSDLILNDNSGNTYTFAVDENNLIFDAEKSSEIPKFEGVVATVDGSIFSLTENKCQIYSNLFNSQIYQDIDNTLIHKAKSGYATESSSIVGGATHLFSV